jgi:hypothetical protein
LFSKISCGKGPYLRFFPLELRVFVSAFLVFSDGFYSTKNCVRQNNDGCAKFFSDGCLTPEKCQFFFLYFEKTGCFSRMYPYITGGCPVILSNFYSGIAKLMGAREKNGIPR